MKVDIAGPNLPRPLCDKGTLHVHAHGCADLKKSAYARAGEPWTIDAVSRQEVILDIYSNQIDESDSTWDDPAYETDVYFAPCCKALPRTTAEAVAAEWRAAYKLWEDGQSPSPSPSDLAFYFLRVTKLKLVNAAMEADIADYIDELEQDGRELDQIARMTMEVYVP